MGGQQVSENQEDPALILESPEVQSFIPSLLLQKSVSSLKPTINFENGVSYPQATRLLPGRSNEQVKSFLSRLSGAGLLEKSLVDRLISCPSCKGTQVYSKYQCDKCKSLNISVVEILEHRLCGYVGAKTSFSVDSGLGGALTCPKCKQSLTNESDYRKLGKTFECASCQTRFEIPPIVHSCKKCEKIFTYKDAGYEPVYEYKVSPKMRELFSSGQLSLNAVVLWLKDRGFRVDAPKEIIGSSKERHKFDVVASAGVMENLLIGDFTPLPDNRAIIAAFAKKYDVNQNAKSFIITYEKVPESIEILAKTYGISIIAVDPQNPASLNEALSRMVGGTPQVIPSSSTILSQLALDTKRVAEKTPAVPRPISEKSKDNPTTTIITESSKTEVSAPRKIKRKNRRKDKVAKSERKAVEKEPRDYYFENDFGTEKSDDVYLSGFGESG